MSHASVCHAGGLLPGTIPLFAALLSVWFLKEKLSLRRVIGLTAIVSGVVVMTGFENFCISPGQWINYAELVTAAFMWGVFTVSMRYWQVPSMQAVAIVSVLSAVFYLPIYFFCFSPQIWRAPLQEVLLQASYQGLTATLAMIAYVRAVAILGASRGAVFSAFVPVLATFMGIVLLGENPSLSDLLAIVFLSIGVFLATGARLKAESVTIQSSKLAHG